MTKRKMPITPKRIKNRLPLVEKALKEALEVARCAFPQDADENILPIDPSHWERMNLWRKFIRARRVSERRFL